MALQRTTTISAVTVGQNEADYPSIQTVNANAVEPGGADLQGGDNQILVPSNGTVNGCWIKAPPSSANAKTVRMVSGDTQSGSFTAWCVYPCTAGGSFIIHSAGAEPGVRLIWI